ncbi:hypothetical protein E1B28_005718 [Marasmius oreades]|uniref:Amino acid transporter transmembrane domain-containing protein n=1 Tax=Marasmius oreades TaxID=181124 RepID=A0A9P7S4G0_9AGAR|nr:uncharacterized protein E1B28_005718 [Marasmius oreades]KAG7094912.1 hypothetical protein E1B28_005718 [Marasmius oreades]
MFINPSSGTTLPHLSLPMSTPNSIEEKASNLEEHNESCSIHEGLDSDEVFKQTKDGVNFRTVGWPRASFIFLKVLFATGVLAIPSTMATLGTIGGALSLVGWGALNTYTAFIQGSFRNNHRQCHTIVDMAYLVGGPILREATSFIYLIAYIFCAGVGILGVSIALNALSDHAICSVWFSLVSTVFIVATASIRKFHDIAWLTWAGFVSIFVAVLIIVIAVTTLDRPAAAPQTGDFDLGYYAILFPDFASGMVATCAIFISTAGTSAFIPVIAEMRRPKDYNKALFCAMGFVTTSYLCFSLVVYRWCGKWVASPSLGSAGPVIEKISYGIALIGLVASGCLYLHVAAKYLFVRFLRNSRHLQSNTVIHWATWLGCTISLGAISFILVSAVPIFTYLISLCGALCFAPLAIMLPACFWLYDHQNYWKGTKRQVVIYILHLILFILGTFVCIGGTYGAVQQIVNAFRSGAIGSAFSCDG